MSRNQTYGLAIFLLIVWLLCISAFRANFCTDTASKSCIRWFNDQNDRWFYMERGAWMQQGGIPYKNVPSEYPQIPTYLFGLPYLLIHSTNQQVIFFWHSSIFSLGMLVTLFFTIRLLYNMLPARKWMAYLLLLPASLYFTYNRFDILPAFLCLVSYLLLRRRQYIATGIVLGIGTFTKWYPILLLPVYLSYLYSQTNRINWKIILSCFTTCVIIVLPTILLAGWNAFLTPYLLQANRGMEQASLPVFVSMFSTWLRLKLDPGVMVRILSLFQIIPAFLSIFVRVDSEEKLINWTLLVTGCFIFFSRIYSPQWILWLMPFLILGARTKYDLALIFVYNFVVYLAFPVVIDLQGAEITPIVLVFGGTILVILTILMGIALSRTKFRFSWNLAEPVFELFKKKGKRAV